MNDRLLKESDVLRAVDKRIEELSKDPVFIRKNGQIDLYGIKKYLLAIPTAERPQGEWIPCKERLPKEYEVLCCDIYKNCIVGHPFVDDSVSTGFCAESEGEFMYECVAWMPLPEPWKGADDDD